MPSAAYLSAVNARVNAEILVTLIHIAHPEMDRLAFPDGIRVHDGGDTVEDTLVSGGITYTPWAFRVRRPDRRSGVVAGIPIEVDNVHPAYGRALLPLTSPPTVTLSAVLKSTPDIIEEGPMSFALVAVRVTRTTITGELTWATGLGMRYPRHRYTPATTPGVVPMMLAPGARAEIDRLLHRPPAWVRDYVGAGYREGAAGPWAYDCYRLAVTVMRDRYGIRAPLHLGLALAGGEAAEAMRAAAHALLASDRSGWCEQIGPSEGDAILFRVGATECHVGVVVAVKRHSSAPGAGLDRVTGGWFLHVHRGIGVSCEEWDSPLCRWSRRVAGFWRWARLQEPAAGIREAAA